MGMTIEERIAQLVRIKHYASPRHYETLDTAIETMRKYEKIKEIVKHYKDNVRDKVTNENMEKILEVVENVFDD